MKNLLTVKDVAERLNVSKSTVYEWSYSGHLPHIVLKSGKKGTIRFFEDALENWLKRKAKETRQAVKIDTCKIAEDNLEHDATSTEGR